MNECWTTGTVVIARRYTQELLLRFPEDRFAFGDNALRQGTGGQAAACRGMPNAVGIITKHAPSRAVQAYLRDADFMRIESANLPAWFALMNHLREGGRIWLPRDGIGTGLAELDRRAPRIFASIQAKLAELRAIAKHVRHL